MRQLDQNQQDQYGRYCYGVFMMGQVPGFTYFKFGEGYNLAQVSDEYKTNPPEVKLELGVPTGQYQRSKWLLSRKFKNGYVLLNLDNRARLWLVPENLELWNGGGKQAVLEKGSNYLINSQAAAFFLKKTADPDSPDLTTVTSCRDYCIQVESSSVGGWCASQAGNCAVNGGLYNPKGDQYCEDSRSCCCKSATAPQMTCREYCQKQGFDKGWCGFKSANCGLASGEYHPAGNQYCASENCCCRN